MGKQDKTKAGGAAALGIVALAAICVPAFAGVFKGTAKSDRVIGTKAADRMFLKGGHDRARGRGGPDRIFGGRGRDRLRGDSGGDRLHGGPGADRLRGGRGGDRLRGGGGRDRLFGGKGADRLAGGGGRDRLVGGVGVDRLAGGPGNDVLNAVDGRRDARVDGGKGRNVCRIDQVDLPRVRRCSKIVVQRGGPGGGGGAPGGGGPGGDGPGGGPGGPGGDGGGPGGGGPGGDGSDDSLVLRSADGLSCASTLPTCVFEISGTGADAEVGTVDGEGGVQPAAGAAVAVLGEDWTASGTYGCTEDGALRVTIGSKDLLVPVSCGD